MASNSNNENYKAENKEKERLVCEVNKSTGKTINLIKNNSFSKNVRNKFGFNSISYDESDELAAQFEDYGKTPPRTRINRKNRDWDRKQKLDTKKFVSGDAMTSQANKRGMGRMCKSRVQRRNTMDCAILNELFINEENKRTDKRAQALLRESERDNKQSHVISNFFSGTNSATSNRISTQENQPQNNFYIAQSPVEETLMRPHPSSILRKPISGSIVGVVPTLIESCNRYMCVSSRPAGFRSSAPASAFSLNNFSRILSTSTAFKSKEVKNKNARKEFHETFANLIKLGNIDRQDSKLSHEETTWQTELKDLIWLELQAWQADRTLEQQDKFLFTARQSVPDLLNQILNYKFEPKFRRDISVISTDSGIGSDSANSGLTDGFKFSNCSGCYSLYCKDCACQQSLALKEVENLLTKLEAAESLYPSSQQMGTFHPVYKSEAFIGRIKAMCLWYNTTRHHRLKLIILGKILSRLQGNRFNWPLQTSVTETSSSHENDSNLDVSSKKSSSNDSLVAPEKPKRSNAPKVQFDLAENNQVSNNSPSESISSNESTHNESSEQEENPAIGEYEKIVGDLNTYNVEPLLHVSYDNIEHSTKLYRKYIENILKSRGLAKSLDFIHYLHSNVLYKAKITLEKPGAKNIEESEESSDSDDEEEFDLEPEIEQEQIDELRRYGYWSPEAKSLNLPSYVPSFIFLAVIPLEVIHEFLRMRLETRPLKPNPLSLEQLMKELREGLTISLTQRERFHRHITTALIDNKGELKKYKNMWEQFDSTVKKVLELYLDYVDQWVLVAAPETHKKSALEQEWIFTKLVSPMVPGMHIVAAKKFCLIIRNLLNDISTRIIKRAFELDGQIEDYEEETELNDDAKKWQLLAICRETQALFTNERERCIKVLFFAKNFCRDVAKSDFHREHYKEYLNKQHLNELVCPEIKDAFKLLQIDVLDVRNKLTKIIERVQDRCNIKNMLELDEQDKQSILSRSREILHQGYKFGFEYQKDVIRLFEQKIMLKNENFESDLAIGIVSFAKMWMQFVNERCERGRGVRPRWANQGLEFLILACDPQITRHLDDKQFEELKNKMDHCISHVIGITSEATPTAEKLAGKKKASPRTRKVSSPATSRSRTPTRASPMSAGVINSAQQKFLLPQLSLKEERTRNSIDSIDFGSVEDLQPIQIIVPTITRNSNESLALRQIRVRDSVNRLDMDIEMRMRQKNLIGQVKNLNTVDKVHIRARSVNFRWHRGIKIGQGRFGKVYTAVNNTTGELMAMKEIQIQPGETRAIKNVAEELKILEGITHRNLVKYYGIEIHREELLIFMELCSEGTLESLIELSGEGLHEALTRRFTAQLLSGVAELHTHGIVHRDIKTANIFIVEGGNSLKLGDFGSAVKIQAHTTVPGELQGYVGTQAYMAPEVFTKTNSDGHGRAADIWSVGCVVIEMSSGKRPWAQFDSNFQIMFKVGMGETPEIPNSLSQEGQEFVEKCLQHDPKLRSTSVELLENNFCKVELEDNFEEDRLKTDNGRWSFRKHKR